MIEILRVETYKNTLRMNYLSKINILKNEINELQRIAVEIFTSGDDTECRATLRKQTMKIDELISISMQICN